MYIICYITANIWLHQTEAHKSHHLLSHSVGQQTANKQKSTARKRRRNQNVEIDELAALVPLSTPLLPPSESSSNSLLASSGGKGSAIDKISVLRLTSTFLKLQNFMKDSEWNSYIGM